MAILKLSTLAANAAIGAVASQQNTGTLRIYSGAMPATADTAASGTLLVTYSFAATAYGAAAAGVITLAGVPITGTINAAGTAGYAAVTSSDGVPKMYLDVGLTGSGADCILSTLTIPASGNVTLNGLTHTLSPS